MINPRSQEGVAVTTAALANATTAGVRSPGERAYYQENRCANRSAIAALAAYPSRARTQSTTEFARMAPGSDRVGPWFADRQFRLAYRKAARPYAESTAQEQPCFR